MNRPVFQNATAATFEGEVIFYAGEAVALKKLHELWCPPLLPVPQRRYARPVKMEWVVPAPCPALPPDTGTALPRLESTESQSKPSDKWLFGFARSFLSAVDSIDRTLQGRILQAIADIAAAPLNHRGDTIKPLSGELSGFWRYRIGNFRLVYYPDEATRTITLCDFASRGSVYD